MAWQRLVIGNLAEVGLVDEIDSFNLKENALTSVRNLKPRKGNLGCASRLGSTISASPVFSSSAYSWV